MIEQRIDYPDFKRLKDEFKQLDKNVQKQTKKGIKSSIGRVTSGMQARIRTDVNNPPMSGMGYGGVRNRWAYPSVKPSLRLSAGPGKPVAQIVAQGKGRYKRMFAITERAGSRSSGFDQKGQRMIRVLDSRNPLVKGKGGRYAFKAFLQYRPQLHDAVERELNKLAAKLNVRLNSGS
jgi:hypothetical protein